MGRPNKRIVRPSDNFKCQFQVQVEEWEEAKGHSPTVIKGCFHMSAVYSAWAPPKVKRSSKDIKTNEKLLAKFDLV